MPGSETIQQMMEFAKFVGMGGAAILMWCVWYLTGQLQKQAGDNKEWTIYTRQREVQQFEVLANLTKVYEQGLSQGRTHDEKVTDGIGDLDERLKELRTLMDNNNRDLKASIDSMSNLLRDHRATKQGS